MWRKFLGPSPISQICIQTDNAPELVSEQAKQTYNKLGFQHRTVAEYVHEDNSIVENAIGRIDRNLRIAFANAPWMKYNLWPGALSYAVEVINISPIKNKEGKYTFGPLMKLTGETQIPPMPYIFGELCKIILNVEKRRQISIAPKITPQATLCYYLCRDLT